MVTLTALYKRPEDTAAFDDHYTNVHTPLVAKVPGLRKMEVSRFSKMLTPPNALISDQPYLECTMYFDNMDSFKAAMASEENKAAGKDLMSFAGPLVSMFVGVREDITL
ncbi:MAG: EthD family reductase [Bacteroidota bacterium]|nr:EthD family reductase [Bacteroidota bacterium]MDP4229022.1 EthD family reductase [Bacteroidota bacterium]MDP4237496.1 EthD family reductase [Bacteroidota bacterium]